MCSERITGGREDCGEGKEGMLERDWRPSNRISKAQLMYTISRGRITGQKAKDGTLGEAGGGGGEVVSRD